MNYGKNYTVHWLRKYFYDILFNNCNDVSCFSELSDPTARQSKETEVKTQSECVCPNNQTTGSLTVNQSGFSFKIKLVVIHPLKPGYLAFLDYIT